MLIVCTGFYRNLFSLVQGNEFQQKTFQQKELSGYLTILWDADPFKSKWSILAKAYSVIRDAQGKKKAPLDGFLDITGPLIGIVPSQDYFSVLGWQMASGINNEIILVRDRNFDIKTIDQELLITNLSVQDLVVACRHYGYVIGSEPTDFNNTQYTLAMAALVNMNGFEKSPPSSVPQEQTLATMTIDELLLAGKVGAKDHDTYVSEDKGNAYNE